MKIRTHYNIARLSLETSGRADIFTIDLWLKRTAFCIGAVLPDLRPGRFLHEHFYVRSGDFVLHTIKKLCNKKRIQFIEIVRLGEMSHYLSDFCCLVHQSSGLDKPLQHAAYERIMDRYMIENFYQLREHFIECRIQYHTIQSTEPVMEKLKEYWSGEATLYHDLTKAVEISGLLYYGLEVEKVKEETKGQQVSELLVLTEN